MSGHYRPKRAAAGLASDGSQKQETSNDSSRSKTEHKVRDTEKEVRIPPLSRGWPPWRLALDSNGELDLQLERAGESAWWGLPPSGRQIAFLLRSGVDPDGLNRGQSARVIEWLHARRTGCLATLKQVHALFRFGHQNPWSASFVEASEFISKGIQDLRLEGK